MNNTPKRIWVQNEHEGSEDEWEYGSWDIRTEYLNYDIEYILASDRDELIKRVVAGMPDLVWRRSLSPECGDLFAIESGGFKIYQLGYPTKRGVYRLLQADIGATYRGDFGGKDAILRAKKLADTINHRKITEALKGG